MTGFRATDLSLASRTLPEHGKPTTWEPKRPKGRLVRMRSLVSPDDRLSGLISFPDSSHGQTTEEEFSCDRSRG